MQYSNSQSLNSPHYQSTPSKNYLLENQMGHPQRRKMYNMHDRHNLISKIDMTWLNSLHDDNLMKKRVIQQKRTVGVENLVEKYNQFVDRELNQRYKGDIVQAVRGDSSEKKSGGLGNNSGLYNSQMLNGQSLGMDRSLNQQIENFKTKNQRKNSSHSNNNSRIINERMANSKQQRSQSLDYNSIQYSYNHYHDINPKQMKQLILRSALDRPQVYQQYQSIDNSTIRNNKPDNLQSYLRNNDRRRYL